MESGLSTFRPVGERLNFTAAPAFSSGSRGIRQMSFAHRTRPSSVNPLSRLYLATALSLCCVGAASAMECPVAHSHGGAGVLKETAPIVASDSETLTHQGAAGAPYIIAGVRTRHPHASNGEILNYLVTAYCPVVNDTNGLTPSQKRARLRHFTQEVEREISKG